MEDKQGQLRSIVAIMDIRQCIMVERKGKKERERERGGRTSKIRTKWQREMTKENQKKWNT